MWKSLAGAAKGWEGSATQTTSKTVKYEPNPPHGSVVVIEDTEEKAKVVAAVWGTKFIKFLAALALLLQDNFKNRINSSFFSYDPGAIHPFLHIILVQNRYR